MKYFRIFPNFLNCLHVRLCKNKKQLFSISYYNITRKEKSIIYSVCSKSSMLNMNYIFTRWSYKSLGLFNWWTWKTASLSSRAWWLGYKFPILVSEDRVMCDSKKYPYLPHRRDFFLRPPTPFKCLGLTEPPIQQEIQIPSVGGV